MPATFPAHAAAVLPLKLWRPGWFDGVALVVGSAAPDAAYIAVGFVSLPETHTVPALLWFCLPVALAGCLVIRWAAPAVAAHLPAGGPFDLRAYGVLGVIRHPWYVTVSSILVGASTHLVWDGFTHAPANMAGWAIRLVPVLDTVGPFGLPWWRTLQFLSSALGAVVVVGVAWYVGRTEALRRWHGDPPPVPRSPGRFWGSAAAILVVCLAVMPFLPYSTSAHVGGVRLLYAVALALVAGAAAAGISSRRSRRICTLRP